MPTGLISVTLSPFAFATQALPAASIAMPRGMSKPPALKPLEPERKTPEGLIFVTVEATRFVAQALPAASIAMPDGSSNPPPTKPFGPERKIPAGLILVTELGGKPAELAAQALPF